MPQIFKLLNLVSLAGLILGAFLAFGIAVANAQTSLPSTQLTPENGWECNATKSSCTNTKTDSPYYRATAFCAFGSGVQGVSSGTSVTCTITMPDGTATTDASYTNAAGTSDGQSFDSAAGSQCGVSPASWGYCVIDAVGSAIIGISTLLLGMAGVFFNLVVVKTVFGFSTLIGNSPGLLTAWGILRDLGNMLLLFGFIFIGIATILDLQTYSAKKALPRLLIFAILMNFSLFAAEAVIDVSNVLSSALYAQANSDPCVGGSSDTIEVSDSAKDLESCILNIGLAGAMMEASGLSTMFQLGNDYTAPTISIYVGLSLFAVIGAVVFFAAGIMLVVRALILTLLMITAPIGFAAMALPPMQKFGEEWWNKLIHQAFLAPILILLILVSLKVSESFAGGNENGLAGALSQPNSSAMGVILVFSLVIGLLIASLIAAKKFGGMGADFVVASSSKLAGNIAFGGTAKLGRGTLGWGASKLDGKLKSSAFAQRNPNLARMASKPLAGIAGSSFDARGTKGVQGIAKKAGLEIGKPTKAQTKGYKGVLEEKVKARVDFEKSLKPTDDQKIIGSEIQKELDELKKKEKEFLASHIESIERSSANVRTARESGDEEALKAARDILRTQMNAYEDAKRSPLNPINAKIMVPNEKEPGKMKEASLAKELEKQLKTWKKRGDELKTKTVVESGLKNRWYNYVVPGTPSASANTEGVEKILSGNKSEREKAFDVLKKEMEKADKSGEDDSGAKSGSADSTAKPA